jgi:hypothetical protein
MKTAENIFLSVPKKVVLLQRSNHKRGMRTADKSCQPFLCLHSINRQVNRLVVCGSSNAHKDTLIRPEQHRKPLLFNVQKRISKMNENKRTAGETAMMGATYEERKNYMVQCLSESSTAILVYFDENCEIKTYGVAPKGDETALLTMLERAASRAKRVAEEVML